jgi:hypothetical protein
MGRIAHCAMLSTDTDQLYEHFQLIEETTWKYIGLRCCVGTLHPGSIAR